MSFRRNNGFTLVELLVVIAIIGLLIAVLLPALSQAKAVAGIARCLNTIGGNNKALYMYAADWKDSIPHRTPINSGDWTEAVTPSGAFEPDGKQLKDAEPGCEIMGTSAANGTDASGIMYPRGLGQLVGGGYVPPGGISLHCPNMSSFNFGIRDHRFSRRARYWDSMANRPITLNWAPDAADPYFASYAGFGWKWNETGGSGSNYFWQGGYSFRGAAWSEWADSQWNNTTQRLITNAGASAADRVKNNFKTNLRMQTKGFNRRAMIMDRWLYAHANYAPNSSTLFGGSVAYGDGSAAFWKVTAANSFAYNGSTPGGVTGIRHPSYTATTTYPALFSNLLTYMYAAADRYGPLGSGTNIGR